MAESVNSELSELSDDGGNHGVEKVYRCTICKSGNYTRPELDQHRKFHRDRGERPPRRHKEGTERRRRLRAPSPAATDVTDVTLFEPITNPSPPAPADEADSPPRPRRDRSQRNKESQKEKKGRKKIVSRKRYDRSVKPTKHNGA